MFSQILTLSRKSRELATKRRCFRHVRLASGRLMNLLPNLFILCRFHRWRAHILLSVTQFLSCSIIKYFRFVFSCILPISGVDYLLQFDFEGFDKVFMEHIGDSLS